MKVLWHLSTSGSDESGVFGKFFSGKETMRWRLEKTVRCPASLGEQETSTGSSQDVTVEKRVATC